MEAIQFMLVGGGFFHGAGSPFCAAFESHVTVKKDMHLGAVLQTLFGVGLAFICLSSQLILVHYILYSFPRFPQNLGKAPTGPAF